MHFDAVEPTLVVVAKIAIIVGLVAAVAFDVRYRVIPNVATSLVAGGGLLLRSLVTPATVWPSLIVAGAVLVVFLLLAWRSLFGGGDAKLIAAATLTQPVHEVALLIVDIALAGGVLAGIYLLGTRYRSWWRGHRRESAKSHGAKDRPKNVLARFFGQVPLKRAFAASIPYAVAVLGGVMWHLMSEIA